MSPRETPGKGRHRPPGASALPGVQVPGVPSIPKYVEASKPLPPSEGLDLLGVPQELRERALRPGVFGLSRLRGDSSQPDPETDRVIADSASESLKETGAWFLELVVVAGAHCINPVLGHAVTIAFKIKEAADDVEGLVSQDSELHLPVLPLGPGIDLELDVHLGSEDGPLVTAFVAPVAGDLCGGFAIEKDEDDDQEAADRKAEPPAKDAGKPAVETTPAPSDDSALYALIRSDLSNVAAATADPRGKAAALGTAASLLQSRLCDQPEFADKPILVVYDQRAGLGMWMIKPGLSDAVAGWIEIGWDASTGWMPVRVV